MPMFRKELALPPEPPQSDDDTPGRPPIEYEPPKLHEDGTARDAVIQAAREHDRQERRIADQSNLLMRAKAELDAAIHQRDELKNVYEQHINELKLQLAEERNHVASYKAERDEAVQDRANAVAILANIGAIIEHGVSAGDIPRKRRNGKRGDVVFGGDGGGAASPSDVGNVSIPNRGGAGSMSDQEGS